ncbi:MAG: hypothetical protein KF799_12460 [Bdellovibrionales bacterium]|nr:hypothetical protein [Bdellovibrionales bacterium]
MPRGDKSKYTNKQKRMAGHIEKGYEKRGLSARESERRAWATVNKETGGAGKAVKNTKPSKKGGHIGGSSQSQTKRSLAAKKGWQTRRHESHAR